ncbi:MAG: NDP-sugar synthase [Candidatus Saganbacteria bacterium]|nr:NDP-sugar synthase [Candidatus Saganbacteria bacterium]
MSGMRVPATINQAIVMAAGKGPRMGMLSSFALRDHEGNMSPCTLPIGGRRIINRVIDQAAHANVNNISVVSHHLAGDVIAGIGHGHIFDNSEKLVIRHVVTPKFYTYKLSIVEALRLNPFPADEPFWLLGGTALHPRADLDAMRDAFATALAKNQNLLGCLGFVLRPAHKALGRFGIAVLDKHNYVTKFIEKPANESVIRETVALSKNAGNETVNTASEKYGDALLPVFTSYALMFLDAFEQTEGDSDHSFGGEIFAHLPSSLIYGHIMPEQIMGRKINEEFFHLATPRDYWLAQWRFLRVAINQVRGIFDQSINSWVGRDVVIRSGAQVTNSVIGDRVYIGPGAVLNGAIVGTGSKVLSTEIIDSVLLPYTYVNDTLYTTRVKAITASVAGGRTTGGTFIDGYTLNGMDSLDNMFAVPAKDTLIKPTPLGLSDADLAEAEEVKKDVF